MIMLVRQDTNEISGMVSLTGLHALCDRNYAWGDAEVVPAAPSGNPSKFTPNSPASRHNSLITGEQGGPSARLIRTCADGSAQSARPNANDNPALGAGSTYEHRERC